MTYREQAEAAQDRDINDDDCQKHHEPIYSGWCIACAAEAIERAVATQNATVAAALLAFEHGLRPELFRTSETHAAAMAMLSETRAQLGIPVDDPSPANILLDALKAKSKEEGLPLADDVPFVIEKYRAWLDAPVDDPREQA